MRGDSSYDAVGQPSIDVIDGDGKVTEVGLKYILDQNIILQYDWRGRQLGECGNSVTDM